MLNVLVQRLLLPPEDAARLAPACEQNARTEWTMDTPLPSLFR